MTDDCRHLAGRAVAVAEFHTVEDCLPLFPPPCDATHTTTPPPPPPTLPPAMFSPLCHSTSTTRAHLPCAFAAGRTRLVLFVVCAATTPHAHRAVLRAASTAWCSAWRRRQAIAGRIFPTCSILKPELLRQRYRQLWSFLQIFIQW